MIFLETFRRVSWTVWLSEVLALFVMLAGIYVALLAWAAFFEVPLR